MKIPDDYVKKLPGIYRDVLAAFVEFDSTRKAGSGLAYQSIYSALDGKYTLGQIKLACEAMAERDVMEIKNDIFAHPTPIGEELIKAIKEPPPSVPPFPPFRKPKRVRVGMVLSMARNNPGQKSNVGNK